MYEEQLCWSCKKAYGSCMWSAFLRPVKGWIAEPTIIVDNRYMSESYNIKQCPEYEYDGICLRCNHYDTKCNKPQDYYKICEFCHSRRKSGDCKNFECDSLNMITDKDKERKL